MSALALGGKHECATAEPERHSSCSRLSAPLREQAHDGGSRLLDGSARDVNAGPVMARTQFSRECDFFGHGLAIDVLSIVLMRFEAEQPVLPNLNDPLRAGIETYNQRPAQFLNMP